MRTRSPRLLSVLVALTGCVTEPPERHDWTDQRVADSPCYDANLLDGLDETSTLEEHQVFACLDQTGTLAALEPVDLALDGATRDDAVGLVLARLVNDLPDLLAGTSLLDVVHGTLDLLDDDVAIDTAAELFLELVYAEPAVDLGTLDLAAPGALDAGVVVPALPIAGTLATTLLDDRESRLWIADLLRSDRLRRVAWTLASVSTSSAAPMQELADVWPEHVADLLERVADTSNDRGAPQNSLRAVAVAALGSDGIGATVRPILEDDVARGTVRASLAEGVSKGWIDPLPGQILRLASEDVAGGTLDDGEDSALVSLLRLLAHANQPADCSIDLGITSIDFSFGNLSVTLLEQFATLDPDTAVSGVDLLGELLGVGLTQDLLQTVADTGVCPVIDDELVNDLGALDRLNTTPELLRQLLSLLGALDAHVPDVVDAITAVYDAGLVPPVEELLRDVADAPIAGDLTLLVPALLEPSGYFDLDELPAGADVLDFDDVWALGVDTLAEFDRVRALVEPVLDADATWTTLANLGRLLDDPEARVAGLLDDLSTVMVDDPDLAAADTLADKVEQDALAEPLLVLVESEALRDAVATTASDDEGPLPWLARMIVDGTLDTLVTTLRFFRDLLEAP